MGKKHPPAHQVPSTALDNFLSEYKVLSEKRLHKILVGAGGAIQTKELSRFGRLVRKSKQVVSRQFATWSLAWYEFALTRGYSWMKRGYGIAALVLFNVLGGSLYGVAQWAFPVLPMYGWALTFLSTTVLAQAFVLHYSALAHERIQREATGDLEDKIWLLEGQLQPSLEITFDGNESGFVDEFVGIAPNGGQDNYKLYRVAITSRSNSAWTRLKVEEVYDLITERKFRNVHLRIMHKDATKNQTQLHAGVPEFWDVIQKPWAGHFMELTHAEPNIGRLIVGSKATLRLIASSDQGFGVTKTVVAEVDMYGDVQFRLEQ